MRIVRAIDLIVLAVALPVFIAASLPILGWAATTVSWVAARSFQSWIEARALAKGERKAVLGARAATLLGRLYLVTVAVFVAGLIEREAGLTAGVLAVIVFTVHFISLFVVHALEEDAQ
jgi:hypothetical protein